jgi:hypothetical protein
MEKLKPIKSKTNKAFKKSICAWCNKVIGIFPIENNVNIISHGICKPCFDKCVSKIKDKSIN